MPLASPRVSEIYGLPDSLNSLASAVRAPERAVLINEDFAADSDIATLPRALEFFWNPNTITVKVATSWARIAVPGLSHEVLQWSHGNCRELDFVLEWSAMEAARRYNSDPPPVSTQYPEIRTESWRSAHLYRDFLHALTAPISRGRAPSRVSLIWADTVQMTGVIPEVEFDLNQFDTSGRLMAFSAKVSFIELRTTFLGRRGVFGYFINNGRTPEGEADARGLDLDEILYGDL